MNQTLDDMQFNHFLACVRDAVTPYGSDDSTPERFADLLAASCNSADKVAALGRYFSQMGERLRERAMERREREQTNTVTEKEREEIDA